MHVWKCHNETPYFVQFNLHQFFLKKHLKPYWAIYFKRVNLMLCELEINKRLSKQKRQVKKA
jgi:hypothetical protein